MNRLAALRRLWPAHVAAFVPGRLAARAALALALVALVAATMVPSLWLVAPALAASLLVLALFDALLAGQLEDLRLILPEDTEVGEAAQMGVLADLSGRLTGQVEASVKLDPRLVEGGRVDLALRRDPGSGAFAGGTQFVPSRRGAGAVEGLWLRWHGPLGLGGRQAYRAQGQVVRVWPNLAAVRSPALQAFLKDSQFGVIARRLRGEGTQFEALADYQTGMDRRRIDWKSSARHAALVAREYEIERNSQIVFALDCGQTMCEPVGGLPRIDRAVSAALATAYVALKGGDRVALFGFAARPELATPFVTDARDFRLLQRAAADLDYHAQEPNFTLALATLAARLARRSLVVIFSDFTDPTSAQLMIESVGRLVSRHVVLFVALVDEELDAMAATPPAALGELAVAVSADALLRQRSLVLQKLRQSGVDVIEARHDQIGTRLIDAYLAIKRAGRIG